MPSAVEVEELTKRYGEFTAVDRISFDVPGGQLLAVMGPNGAGKTTTLEILEGFLVPTSGKVRVLGADPRTAGRAWRARVGLVLQSTSLDAELTVAQTLRLFAQLYPDPRRIREILELLDLLDDAHTKVGVLSGGQRRRVDIALGIIGRPDVLFLDEPTTGLDPEARRRTWRGLEQLTASGTTVVLTTHYIDEAEHLADRLVVIAAGRLITDTTPHALRSASGSATIRYRLPDDVAPESLPKELAHHLDREARLITMTSPDVADSLRQLLAWGDAHHQSLDGLDVGSPSLEEAYLDLIRDHAIVESEPA
jgi:ABC-2 type transport system ATP-binding protein